MTVEYAYITCETEFSSSIIMVFCRPCHPYDEVRLALCIGHPIVGVLMGQPYFQRLIFLGNCRKLDEIVPEEQPVPMLEILFHHMDVMRADPVCIAFDKPGIKGRGVIAPGGPPEIIVPLSVQDRHHDPLRFFQGGDFHQHVDNGFRGHVGYGGAAEVLDSSDQVMGEAIEKVAFFLLEHPRPCRVVWNNSDIFLHDSLDTLFKGLHGSPSREFTPTSCVRENRRNR